MDAKAHATARRGLDQEARERPRAAAWVSLARCLGRSYLVGAAFNNRGMQNIGLAYCMDPGLHAIYGPGARLAEARMRYARHYNTHPFWTPMLVGIFLSMEKKIARGLFPGHMMDGVKGTTIYTLSAIGDSLFGGSVMVLWSLCTILMAVAGSPGWAVAFGAACFAALQLFKAATFLMGYREGLGVLQRFKGWDLINWGQRVKLANAALLVGFWLLAWPGPLVWWQWTAQAAAFGATAWAVNALGLTREVVWAMVLAAYLAYPWLARLCAGLIS